MLCLILANLSEYGNNGAVPSAVSEGSSLALLTYITAPKRELQKEAQVTSKDGVIQHVHTQMIYWHGKNGTVFSVDIQKKRSSDGTQRAATGGSDSHAQVSDCGAQTKHNCSRSSSVPPSSHMFLSSLAYCNLLGM